MIMTMPYKPRSQHAISATMGATLRRFEPRMSRTAALLWHRDSYRTAASHAFARVVREVAEAR